MNLEYKVKGATVVRSSVYENIDKISVEELHEFVIDALNEHGDEIKLEHANKVCDVLIELLEYKGLLIEGVNQMFVEILIATAMIHNLFVEYTNLIDFTKLFTARKVLSNLAEEKGLDDTVKEALFSGIEAQLGDISPIKAIRPNPNTPTDTFATAVWIANRFKRNV